MLHLPDVSEPTAGSIERRKPRVGLVVPRPNTTCESELQAFSKQRFSVHTARMKTVAGSLSSNPEETALQSLREPIEDLALCGVDVVALGCTTAAMACDQSRLADALRFRENTRIVLISQSICQALEEIDAKRVALFTPYTRQSNESIARFLGQNGFEVTTALGLGLNTSPQRFAAVSDLRPVYLLEAIKTMDIGDADCVLVSCTDLHALDILADIEDMKRVPAISSNSAFFRHVERELAA